MSRSVYIETTVVSYLTGRQSRDLVVAAHQQITIEWWEKALPFLQPFVSPLVYAEAARGDEAAARLRLEKVAGFPILEINEEIRRLAEVYLAEIHIPERARMDAYHLATAAFHGIDFVVSWNFDHILNPYVIEVIQRRNILLGIATPLICTPEELMEVQNER